MRNLLSRLPLLVVALLAAAGELPAQPRSPDPTAPDLDPSARLEALLSRIEARQSGIRTLSASFTEHKESSLFLQPVHAAGRFYYAAPDRVRWEYEQPDPMSLLIRGDELVTWYHDLGEAQRLEIGRQSQQVTKLLGMSSSLDTLLEHFTIRMGIPEADGAFRLVLTPRFSRLARRMEELTIWVSQETWLPERFVYLEPGGDRTEYEFADIRVNQSLPERIFELDLPSGVSVEPSSELAGSR